MSASGQSYPLAISPAKLSESRRRREWAQLSLSSSYRRATDTGRKTPTAASCRCLLRSVPNPETDRQIPASLGQSGCGGEGLFGSKADLLPA